MVSEDIMSYLATKTDLQMKFAGEIEPQYKKYLFFFWRLKPAASLI